jgi:hypothetical protein
MAIFRGYSCTYWRFEAKYMGEPDVGNPAVDEADKNTRLARTSYNKVPKHLERFKLGAAVAAAAAFPVLCRPVDIRKIFVDSDGNPVTVKLMDGGAHDNQGVEGLLDRDCTHLIVSDGAGQMGDATNPGHYIPKMVERASGMIALADAGRLSDDRGRARPDTAIQAFGTPLTPSPGPWSFESIGPWLENPTESYRVQLGAATSQLLKPAKQSRLIAWVVAMAAALALGGGVLALWLFWEANLAWSPVWTLVALIETAVILVLYLKPVRLFSFLLFDRFFPFLLAPVLPVVAFVFLLEGWLHRWLGSQSRL